MTTHGNSEPLYNSLLECAKTFIEGKNTKLLADKAVAETSRMFIEDDYCKKVAMTLVPPDVAITEETFSDLIKFLNNKFDCKDYTKTFKLLFTAILAQRSKAQRELFLEMLVLLNPNNYWPYSGVLTDVLPSIALSSEFLASWLPKLAIKEGDDLAGGNAFATAFAYSRNNPEVGIRIIQRYMGEDENSVIGIILQEALAGVRVSEKCIDSLNEEFENLDYELLNSASFYLRDCYHRSWASTLINLPFNKTLLLDKLAAAKQGCQEDQAAAFYMLRRWALHFMRSEDASVAKDVFITWLTQNTRSGLSDLAKHEVAVSLNRYVILFHKDVVAEETANTLIKIAEQVLPIPDKNLGTWRYILQFAARVAKSVDAAEWVNFWEQIVSPVPEIDVIKQLDHNSVSMFWYHIEESNSAEIITRMIFDKNALLRKYGQMFFSRIKEPALHDIFLAAISDKQVLLGVLSFSISCNFEKQLLPFILGIASRIASIEDQEVQKKCLFEIRLMLINYPGTLLSTVKEASRELAVLEEPTQSAEQYFEGITKWQESPINNVFRHEFIDSVRLYKARFDKHMRQAMQKKSLISQLFGSSKKTIYGDSFAGVYNGKVSDATPFQQVSSSFEQQRLLMYDPEGELMRTYHVQQQIKELEHE